LYHNNSNAKGQRSRLHEAKGRFTGLAQASFSTSLGQSAILLWLILDLLGSISYSIVAHSRPPWVNQLFYCGFLSHTIKVVKATEQWTSLLLLECHFRGGALWMHIMPNILLNTGMARQLAIEHL